MGSWGAFMRDQSQGFGEEPVIVGDWTIPRTLHGALR